MKKLVLLIAAFCGMTCAMAQEVTWDFAAPVSSGQTLYFDITDEANLYCEVVSGLALPEGEVVLDAQVVSNMDGKTYTVQGIADNAFYTASSLTKITFPTAATFTYIGKDDYYSHVLRNTGLTGELVIPDNVTFIGGTAFLDDDITSLTLGSGVSTLNNSAFYNTELTHVVLPYTVKVIKGQVFAGNKKLTYIELGNAVEEINANSIAYCDKLDTVVINSITPPEVNGYFSSPQTQQALLFVPAAAVEAYKSHDRWGAFKMIFAIGTEVKFNQLTFQLHTNYAVNDDCAVYADEEYINNGGSLKLLSGETAHLRFESQRFWALEKVLLNGTDITSQVKENQLDVTITEDATLETQWFQPVPAYDFAEEVPSGQKLYFSITDAPNRKVNIVNQSGGRGYSGRQQYAYIEQNGEGAWDLSTDLQPKGDLIIPTTIEHGGQTYTVTAIDTLAFGNCGSLTSVSIPEGITAIGAAAFMRCRGLNGKLVLPASCSVLGEWALRECDLSDIDLGGATSLEEFVLLENNDIKELVTGPAVKQFNINCLRSMWNLESVVIGENVEFVSSGSFAGDYKLKKVKILATIPPVVKWTPDGSESTEWYSYNPSSEGIDATLIVPASPDHSIMDAYKSAACWQLFGTIEEVIPETTVDPIFQSSRPQIIKLVRDGQLYILRDGKTYTVTGQEVK